VGYYIYTDLTNAIVNSAFSSSIRDLGSNYALSIDFSFETSNSDNYNIEFLPGTLEINTKSVNHEEITMSDLEDLTYSGIEQDPKPVLNDGSYVLIEGTDYTIDYNKNKNVGTAEIEIVGIGNYSGVRVADFAITQATLTVTVNENQSKVYGQTDPTFTYEANGFANEEDEEI